MLGHVASLLKQREVAGAQVSESLARQIAGGQPCSVRRSVSGAESFIPLISEDIYGRFLAQLLLEELPTMDLAIKQSEWLRHGLHEVYLEKGDKFDVESWIGKAYHDRKLEQLRDKNWFPQLGRPPAHATKAPQSSNK